MDKRSDDKVGNTTPLTGHYPKSRSTIAIQRLNKKRNPDQQNHVGGYKKGYL